MYCKACVRTHQCEQYTAGKFRSSLEFAPSELFPWALRARTELGESEEAEELN